VPILRSEALSAQSASINTVSPLCQPRVRHPATSD
jgi:hypothetical protein